MLIALWLCRQSFYPIRIFAVRHDFVQFYVDISIRLNGEAAAGQNYTFRIEATDSSRQSTFHLRNGVLVYLGEDIPASFTVKMPTRTLYVLATGASEEITYTVEPAEQKATFDAFVKLLDTPDIFFNIVHRKERCAAKAMVIPIK